MAGMLHGLFVLVPALQALATTPVEFGLSWIVAGKVAGSITMMVVMMRAWSILRRHFVETKHPPDCRLKRQLPLNPAPVAGCSV